MSDGLSITVAEHPLLDLHWFVTEYPTPLGEAETPAWLVDLLRVDADAPMQSSDDVRRAVRDLLRHGGFKPTGRSKPSAEYLVRAASEERLGSINLAVDLGNAVSLHSGLPISVVDLDRAQPPLRVEIAAAGERYVFNPSGQEIDVSGLLCLLDVDGPCANAVKDAQRTKTSADTRRTVSLIWGSRALGARGQEAAGLYRDLVARAGARTL